MKNRNWMTTEKKIRMTDPRLFKAYACFLYKYPSHSDSQYHSYSTYKFLIPKINLNTLYQNHCLSFIHYWSRLNTFFALKIWATNLANRICRSRGIWRRHGCTLDHLCMLRRRIALLRMLHWHWSSHPHTALQVSIQNENEKKSTKNQDLALKSYWNHQIFTVSSCHAVILTLCVWAWRQFTRHSKKNNDTDKRIRLRYHNYATNCFS